VTVVVVGRLVVAEVEMMAAAAAVVVERGPRQASKKDTCKRHSSTAKAVSPLKRAEERARPLFHAKKKKRGIRNN
jgi:hypothetical protein